MNKRGTFFVLLVLLSICSMSVNIFAHDGSGDHPDYDHERILIRFNDVAGQTPNTAYKLSVLNSLIPGSTIAKEYTRVSGLTLVKLPNGTDIETAINTFAQSSSIKYAEPNYQIKLLAAMQLPDDNRFDEQWGMHNTGQLGGTIDADIDAPEAWNISTGNGNIIVAVSDTGVDYTHSDLAGNMWTNEAELNGTPGVDDDNNGYIDDIYGYDFGNNSGNPMDVQGHGTHVAGTIGAVGNNASGVAGVCWDVNVMALKLFGAPDIDTFVSSAIEAIQYAVDNGAVAINASWGVSESFRPDPGLVQGLYDTIKEAGDAGVLFVAAAGNDNRNNDNTNDPAYPQSFDLDNIISVIATDRYDNRSIFSNYGLTSVDIGAPGSSILSTTMSGGYASWDGTSMAAPHVAGACGLLKSADPSLTAAQIKELLMATVDPTLPGLCTSGGRMNLGRAMENVISDTIMPKPNPAEWSIEPKATGPSQIVMKAKEATDSSGVMYYFECITDSNFDSNNGDWQNDRLYIANGLTTGLSYEFHVRVRDKFSADPNEWNITGWSSTLAATPDVNASPAPDPARWAAKPRQQGYAEEIRMGIENSYDQNGVEYFFDCIEDNNLDSSGWQTSTFHRITSGVDINDTFTFRAKARDKSPGQYETGWTSSESVTLRLQSVPLEVPVPYDSIQDAINAAVNGDTVLVQPGTYFETEIDFLGKAITVKNVDPNNPAKVAATIIDCRNMGRAFHFETQEDNNSILAGFTIRNSYVRTDGREGNDPLNPSRPNGQNGSVSRGGAILIIDSSPTIRKCVIQNCIAEGGHGGDGEDGGNNTNGGNAGSAAGGFGGAIYADSTSNPIIDGCKIDNCSALPGQPGDGGDGGNEQGNGGFPGNGGTGGNVAIAAGGAMYFESGSMPVIINCEISNCDVNSFNTPGTGGAAGQGNNGTGPGGNGWPGGNGTGSSTAQGGGIFYESNSNANPLVTNVTITLTDLTSNKSIDEGGGLYIGNFSDFTMINCSLIDNNSFGSDGGGIYLANRSDLTMQDSILSKNVAGTNVTGSFSVNGGGIYARNINTLSLSGCNLSDNRANGPTSIGGGIYAGRISATLSYTTINIDDSTFTDNRANYGGGVGLLESNLTILDSNFISNDGQYGAGLYIADSIANINDTEFSGNQAFDLSGTTGYSSGGGLYALTSTVNAVDCKVYQNSADGSGGGIYLVGPYAAGGNQNFSNCLISENSSLLDGGGISSNVGAMPILTNCTIADNNSTIEYGSGGGLSCYDSFVDLIDSIVWGNSAVYGPQIAIGDPLEITNPMATVLVSYSTVQGGENGIFEGQATDPYFGPWGIWDTGSDDLDPNFISLGINDSDGYYLSNIHAGQDVNSPAIDSGSTNTAWLENELGHLTTTRTDHIEDSNSTIVDKGFHYNADQPAAVYQLTIEVLGDIGGTLNANASGDNAFDITVPTTQTLFVPVGTMVQLKATPDKNPDYVVEAWTDTDDDTYTMTAGPNDANVYNYVFIDGNKHVTVEFHKPIQIEVSGGGNAIKYAVVIAKTGDTLLVDSGAGDYYGPIDLAGKPITITSLNPYDPTNTTPAVIDGQGYNQGFIFNSGEDSRTVVRGFKLINCNSSEGGGAIYIGGGAIYIGANSSPTIRDLTILNAATSGNGGAIYIGASSSAKLTDIHMSNCFSAANGGAIYVGIASTPDIKGCTALNNYASGSGGGIFFDSKSNAVLNDCEIINNEASVSGGGLFYKTGAEANLLSMKVNYNSASTGSGGGIALSPFCDSTFRRVDVIGNDANAAGGGGIHYAIDNTLDINDCNIISNRSKYGGGFYFNSNCSGLIANSNINSNSGDEDGGGVYLFESEIDFSNCNIMSNTGVRGAGLFTKNSPMSRIDKCRINYNSALRTITRYLPIDPFDPNAGYTLDIDDTGIARGGGIFSFAGPDWISDSELSFNSATTSGGGIYLEGGLGSPSEMINCLLTNNSAGRDGGAVSSTWSNEFTITNCTITDNIGFRFGGGVYSSYGSNVDLIDSIIWENQSLEGAQIYAGRGSTLDPIPATVNITHSDVQFRPWDEEPNSKPNAVLVVNPSDDAYELASTLLGEGIKIVGTPTYTGSNISSGIFDNGLNVDNGLDADHELYKNLGINKGIILTTGDCRFAPGMDPCRPGTNVSDSATANNNQAGSYSTDSSVLEFSFELDKVSNIYFNYVFASEEYNEYVNSIFTDAFAFFLDGQNIALVPGSTTPVSLNTINGGNPFGINSSNADLFNNNDLNDGGPFYKMEYDGFTDVLVAAATNLSPGIHTIRLAIADVWDFYRTNQDDSDSAVFLQAHSFSDTLTPLKADIFEEPACDIVGWNSTTHQWDPTANNINADPCFAIADACEPTYYLSDPNAGQKYYSPCIDKGSRMAIFLKQDIGHHLTTRTSHARDIGPVDLGYHYEEKPATEYQLTINVVDNTGGILDASVGGNSGFTISAPYTLNVKQGTIFDLQATADSNNGYVFAGWSGTDDDTIMGPVNTALMDRNRTITAEFHLPVTIYVPHQVATIEEAVEVARNGDTIIVGWRLDGNGDPLPYTVTDPNGINFKGKSITIQSEDPLDKDIVAKTVIDCNTIPGIHGRAFQFINGEDANAIVSGFTIINGLASGPIGDMGVAPPIFTNPNDANVTSAWGGADATGNGYGAAIYIVNNSSPTISYCVIKDCNVSGAIGGGGMQGFDEYNEDNEGQIGGYGGRGFGNGRGGAIYIGSGSKSRIEYCTMINNQASGAIGGDGGNGGSSNNDTTLAGGGGSGGSGSGRGMGGAIFVAEYSAPVIESCTFEYNTAVGGLSGAVGIRGDGRTTSSNGNRTIVWNGSLGQELDVGYGGAVYVEQDAAPDFNNCSFSSNRARGYSNAAIYDPLTFAFIGVIETYAAGGAFYSGANSEITLRKCSFDDNFIGETFDELNSQQIQATQASGTGNGGALYSGVESDLTLVDCRFIRNNNHNSSTYFETGNTYYPFHTREGDSEGGAVYLDTNSVADINNCVFSGNSGYLDGGAIYSKAKLMTVAGSAISGNLAKNGNGGGMYAYNSNHVLEIKISDSTISQNDANNDGGGICIKNFDADFTNCYFVDNAADRAAAIYAVDGFKIDDPNYPVFDSNHPDYNPVFDSNDPNYDPNAVVTSIPDDPILDNCIINNNTATGNAAGGAWFINTEGIIRNCEFMENQVIGVGGQGAALGLYSKSPTILNCLFYLNFSSHKAGAIMGALGSSSNIINCTFADNTAQTAGGAIYLDESSTSHIVNSIFANCNNKAIYKANGSANPVTLKNSHFWNHPPNIDFGKDYYIYDTAKIIDVNIVPGCNDPNDCNDSDQRFVSGPLGNHYLELIIPEVAINGGDTASATWGLDQRTTRADEFPDTNKVDVGYHYQIDPPKYQLNVTVIGEGAYTVKPKLKPGSSGYSAGTIVRITANPDAGWRIKAWKGTNDESSTELEAFVVMSSFTGDVSIEFEKIATLLVPTSEYPTIQRAIDAAKNGDEVVIAPGEYYPPGFQASAYYTGDIHLGGIVILGKDITLRSSNPDNPNLTTLRGYRLWFVDVTQDTVVEGFSMKDSHWFSRDGRDAPTNPWPWGGAENGSPITGGAINMYNSSPQIINLVMDNIEIESGRGGDGHGGTINGGWAGSAYGGAVYLENSNPTFKGVKINDCAAFAGNGGEHLSSPGSIGRGGNWEFKENDADWWHTNWGLGWHFPADRYGNWKVDWNFFYNTPTSTNIEYDDYWLFTAMGGAVYINKDSNPVFEDCYFTNNSVEGGYCGIGHTGVGPDWPDYHHRIESFGGAVYCEVGSSPEFINCSFSNNVADDIHGAENHSPYIGYGGALANGTLTKMDTKGQVKLTGCKFTANSASAGGAIYWADAQPVIFDCNFTGNTAYEGAGMFFSETDTIILSTIFRDNSSGYYQVEDTGDANDANSGQNPYREIAINDENVRVGPPRFDIFGLGAGMFGASSPMQVGDCLFFDNNSTGSGGGVYIFGDIPDAQASLNNCLFVGNSAVIEGGGLAASFNTDVHITNCTFTKNEVTGLVQSEGMQDIEGFGGGISCTYSSQAWINNSIIWDNLGSALMGNELSVGAYDPNGLYNVIDSSQMIVNYSDVKGGQQYVFTRPLVEGMPDVELIWVADPYDEHESTNLHGTSLDDPLFFVGPLGDYYLSQLDSNDSIDPCQVEDSPCVDRGDPNAGQEMLPFGKYRYTTKTALKDETLSGTLTDQGRIDIGFHYRKSGIFNNGDIDYSSEVDFIDVLILLESWLEGCSFPGWCNGSDLNQDGIVNFADLSYLNASFGQGDTEAPEPDPMRWDIVPSSTKRDPFDPNIISNQTWIAMKAVEALDNSGGKAEYYFACVYSGDPCNPGHDSGWIESMTYTDTGLTDGVEYGYKVMARDTSDPDPNSRNKTNWSFVGYAVVGEDTQPPQPNPMQWLIEPKANGWTSITMTAVTAQDDFGTEIEYYFERISDVGDANSGWVSNSTWVDTIFADPNQVLDPNNNFDPNTLFGYRVKARDVYPDANDSHETGWSEFAYTILGEDNAAPSPNPMMWENPPAGDGGTSITMTAVEAIDAPGTIVEYYFNCLTDSTFSSDWTTERTYTAIGFIPGIDYCFEVRARDELDNRTDPSVQAYADASIDLSAPRPNPMTWEIAPVGYSDTDVIMRATAALDTSGEVWYMFQCVAGNAVGGDDQGWSTNQLYIDEGLTKGVQYGYRVKAKDAAGNETEWSTVGYAIAEDATAPAPNPMTFISGPHQNGPNSISMLAANALDPSGVEYYFENVTGNGHDRNWQDNPLYIDTGLIAANPNDPNGGGDPNTNLYGYRVRARDKSTKQNLTEWSFVIYTTLTPPPTPNPSMWALEGLPQQTNSGGTFGYGFYMEAVPATHSLGVEYFFECTNNPAMSSGWQLSPIYFRGAVGSEFLRFYFRVKTRQFNNPWNETEPSFEWPTIP